MNLKSGNAKWQDKKLAIQKNKAWRNLLPRQAL